jgi:hypothetical protein
LQELAPGEAELLLAGDQRLHGGIPASRLAKYLAYGEIPNRGGRARSITHLCTETTCLHQL